MKKNILSYTIWYALFPFEIIDLIKLLVLWLAVYACVFVFDEWKSQRHNDQFRKQFDRSESFQKIILIKPQNRYISQLSNEYE